MNIITASILMKRHLLLFVCCLLLGCSTDARLSFSLGEQAANGESRRLREIFEEYFEAYLPLFPTFATSIGDHRYDDQLGIAISEQHRAKQRDLYHRSLAELAKIDRPKLGSFDELNYTAFDRLLRERLAGFDFDPQLLPLRQLNSLPIEFPVLGSGRGEHPFNNVTDYQNFLKRIASFPTWVDTAIGNMRIGIERGIVQPTVVMNRTLPQLDAMIVSDPKQSLFFQPILGLPPATSDADKTRLALAYTRAIEEQIVPSYRKLSGFVKEEYLPKTRSTVAWSSLPDGEIGRAHV